jgi:hypothetical protein
MSYPHYCFQDVDEPSWFKRSTFTRRLRWLTWSSDVRNHLHKFAKESGNWPEPNHIRLLGGREFDHTFSHGLERIRTLESAGFYVRLAKAVASIREPGEALLFRELFDDSFDGTHLMHLWAVLRDLIAEQAGQPMAALYAPLSYVGRSARRFPLHADLYAPQYLWNVFDRVPADGSGAALLLSLEDFFALADKIGVGNEAQTRFRKCLTDETIGERFRYFYDQMHVNGETWSDEWGTAAEKAATRLPLGAGEGYLIHDRSWLHGREAPTGGVTVKRVHRLVYGLS